MRAEAAATAHAVFFPFPAQGHVTATLHLARLLHVHGGVRVTFIHSDRNRRRVLRSRGPDALAGASGFRFASVPDGLPPPSNEDEEDDHSPEHIAALLASIDASVPHVRKILDDAAASGTPATCVVSDIEGVLRATKKMGLPAVAFWAMSACSLMSSLLCQQLIDRGLIPLKGKRASLLLLLLQKHMCPASFEINIFSLKLLLLRYKTIVIVDFSSYVWAFILFKKF